MLKIDYHGTAQKGIIACIIAWREYKIIMLHNKRIFGQLRIQITSEQSDEPNGN